ncbi:MAG TPA: heavy metal-binding domain-containing protein [Phycisphaerales bacterium]|jgi:hypothetical protein
MKTTKRSILFALFTAGAALALAAPSALAQHSHGDDKKAQPGHKDDGHSHGPAAKAPDTYAKAVAEMASRAKEVEEALNKGDLDAAHDEGDAIAAIARSLGALALKPDSGVDKAKVKEINNAGKAIAEQMDAIHEAGEKKDTAAAKAAFAKGKAQIDSLAAAAPAKYFCPMHCEGSKTYDKPGECPVCHMKLKKLTSEEFSVSVKPVGGKIEAGKPANLVFTLKDPMGMAVKGVEIVHEKPLHLLMVSKDLSWYAHEHPELQPDGTFTLAWTFPAGGEYTLFHDFTPKDVGMQVVPVTLTVDGPARAAKPLAVDSDKPKTVDGYTVTLDTGGPVTIGKPATFSYTISKDGKPVNDLTPYLGAMGHLVIISQDLKQFVHSHPHEHADGDHDHAKQGHADMKGGPKVDFEAHFKAAGVYKGWAQFQHDGKVITVPFTFNVAKGEGKDEHGEKGKDEHKHSAAPANTVCPITADAADAKITRDFKGQAVAFHDPASAAAWEKLSETEKMSKFVAAIAASSAKGGHDGDDSMPTGVSADDERALYLTPGGVYTEADIKANGSVTAGDKYKGKMAKHDMKPKAGDKVCPITMTKANPKFTWIIGGKTYEFCCPPCIDEYVLLAKTSPKEVLDPSEYIKK